ncbi:cellulose biosynthesis cyclic di-GMP-binding regulatory protein BcsB [Acerihabitans sp. TG2]|uniref:cellulose biosynthesis cyclic di-GMP-binding regulatory protein BcsB n=1 Tax=Acerihabitans sp. TG2 TaxID=3096008 RepID=UPI002B224558|nr:cellulose biosynthesis cyclic di-GMP-binding regulatory protein BcsB [Acerihabitans sp. TG2]MEA9389007.1 cellulose biosynthesis cyclic di-GMP-binding regulatory protein BcsB [Acerihabitans sp. TG2]
MSNFSLWPILVITFSSLGLTSQSALGDTSTDQGVIVRDMSSDLPTLPPPGPQPDAVNVTRPASSGLVAQDEGQTQNRITLNDMGATDGFTLSGTQLQTGVVFTVPHDLAVTSSKLTIVLHANNESTVENYNLQLMLNGQPLGSLPLNKTGSAGDAYSMDIPASMITDSNNLSFSVMNSNDMNSESLSCVSNLPTSFKVSILPSSSFEYTGLWLDMGRNLAHFPKPFFESQQMNEPIMPMAFSATPSPAAVGASAIVSSWLGALSGYRGARFKVLLNQLPQENGFLFGLPGERIGDVLIPDMNGPGLQIIDNPLNPAYKLIIVTGKNEAELRQAALRLVTGPLPKEDNLHVVPRKIIPRQPYDAPRWISIIKPTLLRTLSGNSDALVANGVYHGKNNIAFRASPDLFMWGGQTIPLTLSYQFPVTDWMDEKSSHLNISMNGHFIQDLPVNKKGVIDNIGSLFGIDDRQEQATVNIDPSLIYGDNQLGFYFSIKAIKGETCKFLHANNIKSQIGPDSTIDLSHSYHFAQLPNLSYFIGASFPFSRNADFSQTYFVLPAVPSVTELETVLFFAARAGNATGIPIALVRVVFGHSIELRDKSQLPDADIIAVGTLQQTDFMHDILQGSPFSPSVSGLDIRNPDLRERLISYAKGDWLLGYDAARRYLASLTAWRGFISFQSGSKKDRVVVIATASDNDQLAKLYDDLQSPTTNANIRGDISIISDDHPVRSFSVGPQFASGDLPGYMKIFWYARQHVLALSFLCLAIAIIIGRWFYSKLIINLAKRLLKNSKN